MLGSKLVATPLHNHHKFSPRYYVALDGLRAIAVLMVFCQHYGAARAWIFGWGWTGVDIFFVLPAFSSREYCTTAKTGSIVTGTSTRDARCESFRFITLSG